MAPKYLGVKAVIAKSFARIHRRNLIAQGIPPLSFQDEVDYARARQGDTWEMPGIRAAVCPVVVVPVPHLVMPPAEPTGRTRRADHHRHLLTPRRGTR